ncbi:hypothetical protein B484DRAFT_451819 [Ochromonadaceae sp. CCMP2298]|nr:hypothetical protein B484DRAFT_451819 [Ochromonadaceae sp. CCMP2298]
MRKKEDNYTLDKDEMMGRVQEFCASSNFEVEFEKFAMEHRDVFMQSLQFDPVTDEHPLAFHEVYKKYLTKFEGMIEQFIVQSGYTVQAFYSCCQEAMDSEELFGTRRFFVETMLATSEYSNFFLLMRGEMRQHQKDLAMESDDDARDTRDRGASVHK